jgi:hypothetical protein
MAAEAKRKTLSLLCSVTRAPPFQFPTILMILDVVLTWKFLGRWKRS